MADHVKRKVAEAGGAADVMNLLNPPVSLQSVYDGMSGKSRHKKMTLRLFEFFFAKQLKGLEFEHIDKFVLKRADEAKRTTPSQGSS